MCRPLISAEELGAAGALGVPPTAKAKVGKSSEPNLLGYES